jgi:hypothetical protein
MWALGLLAVLVALVPVALASPSDPLWIGGIYDAADSDDVLVAATSLDSVAQHILLVVSPVSIVARAPLTPALVAPDAILRSTRPRAPPQS